MNGNQKNAIQRRNSSGWIVPPWWSRSPAWLRGLCYVLICVSVVVAGVVVADAFGVIS